MMTTAEKLTALRRAMTQRGLAAYLVPTDDFHASEYVGDYFKAREYLSGFTGSAGTLLILPSRALLWTDGRYFLQAESQLAGSGIELMRSGEPDVPTLERFLLAELEDGSLLGFDARTVNTALARRLGNKLRTKHIRFAGDEDLVDALWPDRPPLSAAPVWELGIEYAGEARADKLARVRAAMADEGADAFVVTALDELAWLLDLRGNDVACTPVFLGFLLLTKEDAVLCARAGAVGEEVKASLAADGVRLADYEGIYGLVRALPRGTRVLLDGTTANYRLTQSVPDDAETLDRPSPIVPMKAAFDKRYASRLDGDNVKDCATRWDMVEALREDIRRFKTDNECDRIVVIWAASTEIYVPVDEQIHGSLAALEAAMKANDTEHVAPSMCYAYAALAEGAPFIMGAPNTTVDIPAMWEMAEKTKMPIAGKDFKTGQTLVKSGFAPIIGTRCLGLSGWFSTNILGNRDGLVLDEPANFHTKEVSKLSTLESILVPENQPDLYTNYYHKVRINYYPPRNDDKEGWDNIDIFGWMGYPMQIKINFLCRDSILAAPLLLDLVLLSDLAARKGRYGTQRFLSFFLKAPMHDYTKGEEPVNHLYQQYTMLKNAIREMGGYEADEEID